MTKHILFLVLTSFVVFCYSQDCPILATGDLPSGTVGQDYIQKLGDPPTYSPDDYVFKYVSGVLPRSLYIQEVS